MASGEHRSAGDLPPREEHTDRGLGPLGSASNPGTPSSAPTPAGGSPSAAPASMPASKPARPAFAATLVGVAAPEKLKVTPAGEPSTLREPSAREALDDGVTFARDYKVVRARFDTLAGRVYEATQTVTGRTCALRVLDRSNVSADARRRFIDEARVGASAAAPRTLAVYDAGHDDATGLSWVASEPFESSSLAHRLDALGLGPTLDEPVAWRIVGQVLRGLLFAHAREIAHADVRPSNVLLVGDDVKLTGFGVARLRDRARDEARLFSAWGAALFMGPEQATGGVVGVATDVWAVGLLAFRVLTGFHYWFSAGSDDIDVTELLGEMHNPARGSARERARKFGFRGALPEAFDAWFATCTAPLPVDRFRTVAEAAEAFNTFAPESARVEPLDGSGNLTRTLPSFAAPADVAAFRVDDVTERETIEPVTQLKLQAPRIATMRPPPAHAAPTPTPAPPPVDEIADEAPTQRLRAVGHGDAHTPIAPAIPSAHPPPARSVAPPRIAHVDAMPAPEKPRPPKKKPRAVGPIVAAVAMGAACVYAVHLAAGPGGLPGLFTSQPVVEAGDGAAVPPTPIDAASGAFAGVMPWAPRSAKVWNGTLRDEGTELTFLLVLRPGEEPNAVTGFFSWTVVRLAGGQPGEQVRENVAGTWDPVLGALDLHGTLSTNPVLLPVGAYQLRVDGSGTLDGHALEATTLLHGALGDTRDAPAQGPAVAPDAAAVAAVRDAAADARADVVRARVDAGFPGVRAR